MTAAELYEVACRMAQAADDVWQAELVANYGRSASEARYDLRGTATPLLRAMYEAKRKADDVLHDAAVLRLEAARA